jgi:pimeloyl-ACP methyl ester carboxylesterase
VDDLEAVVDAANIERFALLGISQGCSVSIAYAARHPERVSHLVLYGGFAVGWRKRPRTEAEKEAGEAMLTLMRLGWGQENPAFRQLFTSQFIPGGTKEQADWFNELQRISCSPADAVRFLVANGDTDVTSLLAQVKAPTLVMHARHDARVPFEGGRRMAAGIPGARFVPLEGRNHMILESEPAFPRFLDELRTFLSRPQ